MLLVQIEETINELRSGDYGLQTGEKECTTLLCHGESISAIVVSVFVLPFQKS